MSAAFEAGTDDNKRELFFGSSGIVYRTLDHWRDLLDEAFKLIESLRAELFKSRAEAQQALAESRAETQKVLAEKGKEEGERLHGESTLRRCPEVGPDTGPFG